MEISKRGFLHIRHTHLHVLCFTDQIPSAFQFHVARALTRKRCETNEAYASYEQANGNCGWNRPHVWNNPSSGNEHTSKRANWAEEEVDAAAIRIVQRGGRLRRLQQPSAPRVVVTTWQCVCKSALAATNFWFVLLRGCCTAPSSAAFRKSRFGKFGSRVSTVVGVTDTCDPITCFLNFFYFLKRRCSLFFKPQMAVKKSYGHIP